MTALPKDYRTDAARFAAARESVSRWSTVGDVHPMVAARIEDERLRPVLDMGCGDGALRMALPAEWPWVGLDEDEALLRAAGRPATLSDAGHCPVRDVSFGAVAALWMLYHLDEPRVAISEAHRALRPGGLFATSTTARDDSPQLVEFFGPPDPTPFDAEEASRHRRRRLRLGARRGVPLGRTVHGPAGPDRGRDVPPRPWHRRGTGTRRRRTGHHAVHRDEAWRPHLGSKVGSPPMASSAKLERLLNLTAALLETPRPLTAEEIAEGIFGYPEDKTAFRRAFERDKDALREMGIPIVMAEVAGSDPPQTGYRIPKDQYYIRDPGLEADELAALHLAASAIRLEGVEGTAGLWKLGGVPARPSSTDAPATMAAIPVDDRLVSLFGAVGDRRPVTFTYRDERRTVDPYRLDFHRGRWYVTGFDHARGGRARLPTRPHRG